MKKLLIFSVFLVFSVYADTKIDGEAIGTLFKALKVGKAAIDANANKEVGPADEFFLGREAAARLLGHYDALPVEHPLNQYVGQVGSTLQLASNAPYLYRPYTFIVLDSSEVNAFAAPGGIIMITLGMLKFVQNEDELAAVLAHEIGHVEMEHGLKAVDQEKQLKLNSALADLAASQADRKGEGGFMNQTLMDEVMAQMNKSIRTGYSVEIEGEADQRGLDLLYRAGYDPYALAELIERFKTFSGSYGGAGYPEQRGTDAYKYLKTNGYTKRQPLVARTERFKAIINQY